jgi:hypothetical protein
VNEDKPCHSTMMIYPGIVILWQEEELVEEAFKSPLV